jgi:hypothetical protein
MKICQKRSVVVVVGGASGGHGGGGGGGGTTSDHSLQIPIFFHGLDKTCESVPLSLLPLFVERERQTERERGTKQGADFWWEREKREKKQGDKGVMRGKELHKDMYI